MHTLQLQLYIALQLWHSALMRASLHHLQDQKDDQHDNQYHQNDNHNDQDDNQDNNDGRDAAAIVESRWSGDEQHLANAQPAALDIIITIIISTMVMT